MKKKSVITMLVILALGMPMTASGQRHEVEYHQRKEMKDKFRPKAMQDEDFRMMCKVVKDASFSDKMIGVIKVACISSYFTSKQCAQLLSMFSFENDKLKALKVLHPRMLDIDAKPILKQFTFSNNKDKAIDILLYR